tara:strand:+ start:503 stop:1114 length:612 start_codon:yes stop_codon:yes gene_type:complete
MTDNNVLLSPSEAAELLNVSPVTLRQWSQKGRIPFQITPGGHRRYKRSELYSFAKIMGMELSDPSAPAQTDFVTGKPLQSLSILIVDDNKELCEFLKVMLERYEPNWQITLAHDGFEAGLRVQQLKPDVMIVDLNLPGLNGDELCLNIKSIDDLKHVRLIGMSGMIDAAGIDQFLRAGAEIVLEKPITQEDLTKSITSIFRVK